MGRACELNGDDLMVATEDDQKHEWHRIANLRKCAAEYPNYDDEMTWPEAFNASCYENIFTYTEQLSNRCGLYGAYFVDL